MKGGDREKECHELILPWRRLVSPLSLRFPNAKDTFSCAICIWDPQVYHLSPMPGIQILPSTRLKSRKIPSPPPPPPKIDVLRLQTCFESFLFGLVSVFQAHQSIMQSKVRVLCYTATVKLHYHAMLCY